MAYYCGFVAYGKCGSSFGDGVISWKNVNGTIRTFNEITLSYNYRNTNNNLQLFLGTSTSPESIDSYQAPTGFGSAAASLILSYFDAATRKLITVVERTYINTTGSEVNITESALTIGGAEDYTTTNILVVRDVFDAVTLAAGEAISWKYVLEIAYPE
jgi:hypothetical protein